MSYISLLVEKSNNLYCAHKNYKHLNKALYKECKNNLFVWQTKK